MVVMLAVMMAASMAVMLVDTRVVLMAEKMV